MIDQHTRSSSSERATPAWKRRGRRRAWGATSRSARCRWTRSRTCRAIPPIGGTAKGHLVREIDALGGLMGIAIDATAIQFKLLNRSRGPAVWSPRAQADKRVYSAWVRAALEREPNISWIIGKAGRILVEDGRVAGLAMEDGDTYRCDALVVTTGTFLNGLVHVGRDQKPAGRAGEPPSRDLAESLKSFGFAWGRLKTGTPPRLHKRSIDFSRFPEERGDDPPVPFSFLSGAIDRPQIACHLVHTTERVHALVREHIARVAALQRADLRHRSALLPVARGQGDAVSAPRASPDLPRARGTRGRRDLRQRLLDEPSGGRPGEDRPRAAGPGGRGDHSSGLRRRIRLHPADRAR